MFTQSPARLTRALFLAPALTLAVVAAPRQGSSVQLDSHPVPTSIRESCRDADLVFEGIVESIEYRRSEALEPGDLVLPHTFVTFRLDEVFRGEVVGNPKRLTLRILGGYDADGSLSFSVETPDFRVGSHELVFVKNHETWGIPFVHGTRRILIEDGRAYHETGRLLADPRTVRKLVREQGHDDGSSEAWTGDPLDVLSLRQWVVETLGVESAPATIRPVRSASVAEPFSIGGIGLGRLDAQFEQDPR